MILSVGFEIFLFTSHVVIPTSGVLLQTSKCNIRNQPNQQRTIITLATAVLFTVLPSSESSRINNVLLLGVQVNVVRICIVLDLELN